MFSPVLYPNINCAIMATKEAIISGNVTIICRIKICIEIGKVELEMEKEIKNEIEKRGRKKR